MMQRGRNVQLALLAGALAVTGWSAQMAQAAPPAVEAKGLPDGWQAAPLGTDDTLQDKQSVTVENGKWTIEAGGNDLWTEADGGLIVYTQHTGNGSVSFRLISQTGGHDDGWVKTAAGFRESLEAGARDVHISYTSANRLEPAARIEPDTTPTQPGRNNGGGAGLPIRGSAFVGNGGDNIAPAGRQLDDKPLWIGVDRNENAFGYYWSEDGKIWNKIGNINLELPAEVLAGIEASKHANDPDVPNQVSVLDNVSVSNELLSPKTISGIEYLPRDKGALIVWNPASGVDGVTYNVYQVNQNLSERKKLNAEPINGSSFVAEGLTNGERYMFAISAIVDGVESPLQTPLPMVQTPREDIDLGEAALALPYVVPNPPVLGGFGLVNIGTATPGEVTVTGEGAAAKITMKAGGWDIWESADGFAFLAMPMEGDLDVSARFVRGPTETEGGGGWELGGPMFRESLDSGSRFAMAQVARANELQFKRRKQLYALPTNTGLPRDDNEARPVSVRLVRKGDTFQAFYAEGDSTEWKPLGDDETSKDTIPGFNKMPLVGIALSAHAEGTITEAEIDNFVIKPAE